jgi:hypothetical protein
MPPSDDPMIQFRKEVAKASAVLDFLIEEGHPYHVPDGIIETIERARDLAQGPTAPSAAERAELLKAYRDLVAIPGSSVLEFPPTPFWKSRWRRGFLWIGVVLPIAVILLSYTIFSEWRPYRYLLFGFSPLPALTIWGLYVFTGMVTNHKLNQIIAYCYLFTGLVIGGSLLPWAIPDLFSSEDTIKAPVSILRGCAAANDDVPDGVKCKANNFQWVFNIGGVVAPEKTGAEKGESTEGSKKTVVTPAGHEIQGGLVVPLYVIVLSLIGGAVSMTRRVPEYQRQAMSLQDSLTNQQAREYLVFEIMQVISAPLIAIVAYYIVSPDSTTWAVVLGFGSGFASEPILLMIRALVEKLTPAEAAQTVAAIVRVEPATKQLRPGESQQFTARVSGLGSAEVIWHIAPPDAGFITQSGHYTAPASAREGAVTITATSILDRTKSGNATVTISDISSP